MSTTNSHLTIEFCKRINHPFPLFSWIIQLVEGTPYSHVVVKIDSGVNREFVYHSHFSGVNFLSKKLYKARYKSVKIYKFTITKKERQKLITYFLDNAGEEYPLMELVGVLFVRIANRLGFNIKNPLGTSKMFCSELAFKIIKILGYKFNEKHKVMGLQEIEDILNDH
jgi:hypothetical protein